MLDDATMTPGTTLDGAPGGADATLNAQVVEQIISTLVISQVITVNTLHAHGVIDKRHFAHAFARAIDVLPKSDANRLVVAILQVLKGYHMQTRPGEQSDVRAWVQSLLDQASAPDA